MEGQTVQSPRVYQQFCVGQVYSGTSSACTCSLHVAVSYHATLLTLLKSQQMMGVRCLCRDLCATYLRQLKTVWYQGGDTEVLRSCVSIVISYTFLKWWRCSVTHHEGKHCVAAESPCSACPPLPPVGIAFFERLAWQLSFVDSTGIEKGINVL